MDNIPIVPADTPVIEPAKQEVVYDSYALVAFNVQLQPNGKTPAQAVLVPIVAATKQTATPDKHVRVVLDDVFVSAKANPKVAAAITAITEAVLAVAKGQRKI